MKDDWRDVGELIREQGRRFLSDFAKHEQGKIPSISYRSDGTPIHKDPTDVYIESCPIAWLSTGFADIYDPTRFDYRRWLHSHPLPTDYRDPQNGRPRGDASRAAATIACHFYDACRVENRKREINDYGHRREMKDFAARAVVEDIFAIQFEVPKLAWMFPTDDVERFIEIVRQLMEKPRGRRDPGENETFDFLASASGLTLNLPPKPTSKS
jgi:hypothetical protein